MIAAMTATRGAFGLGALLRTGLRLVLCIALALLFRQAWAQAGGGVTSLMAQAPSVSAGLPAPSAVTPVGAAASVGPWATAAHFIMLPWVTVLLLVAGCLLLFHDLLTPFTWGATGTIGVALIGLVFAANVTQHTHGWVGVLLLLVGLALLLAEIHVVPGRGMAAIGGLLFLFLGMFTSLGGLRDAAFSLSVSSLLTIVTLLAFFAYLPKSAVWKQIGREMRQRAALAAGVGDAHASFLGRQGVLVTGLHPYGVAQIDGVQLEVVTEGEFLSPGTPIIVSRVEGNRVVVDTLTAAAAEEELRQATLG